MPDHGIDANKLEILARWADGLQHDGRVEVEAAGRAILLLIEEIERLHVLIWDRQLYPEVTVESGDQAVNADPRPTLFDTLRARLQRGSTGGSPQPESATESTFHR